MDDGYRPSDKELDFHDDGRWTMEKAMIPIIEAFKSQNIYLKCYNSENHSQSSIAETPFPDDP